MQLGKLSSKKPSFKEHNSGRVLDGAGVGEMAERVGAIGPVFILTLPRHSLILKMSNQSNFNNFPYI